MSKVEPRRVTIEDALTPATQPLLGFLRADPSVRAVAVAADQVVNRMREETREFGSPLPADSFAHADDLKQMDRMISRIQVALDVAQKIREGIVGQFPRTEAPAETVEDSRRPRKAGGKP